MTASQRLEQSAKKPLLALKHFTVSATSSMPTFFNEKTSQTFEESAYFKIVCFKNYK